VRKCSGGRHRKLSISTTPHRTSPVLLVHVCEGGKKYTVIQTQRWDRRILQDVKYEKKGSTIKAEWIANARESLKCPTRESQIPWPWGENDGISSEPEESGAMSSDCGLGLISRVMPLSGTGAPRGRSHWATWAMACPSYCRPQAVRCTVSPFLQASIQSIKSLDPQNCPETQSSSLNVTSCLRSNHTSPHFIQQT
jgi:hypothetical protein